MKKEDEKKSIGKEILKEFEKKDVIEVLVGASILAIPVGFTEETWPLGESLPIPNIFGILILSLAFISVFVYYQYHHKHYHPNHVKEFTKRVAFTYIGSFLVVAIMLTLIQQAPWSTEAVIALKRTVLVTFPASMIALVADMFK